MAQVSQLPPRVALLDGAVLYRSNSQGDLFKLADRISRLNDKETGEFMAPIFTMETMFTHVWLRAAIRVAMWRHKVDKLKAWQRFFDNLKSPTVFAEMREQTTKHILEGKDREERTSVGGWSQREINFASNLLHVIDGGAVLAA